MIRCSRAGGGEKLGKPCDKLIAPEAFASWLMTVNIVVPTFGSLLVILVLICATLLDVRIENVAKAISTLLACLQSLIADVFAYRYRTGRCRRGGITDMQRARTCREQEIINDLAVPSDRLSSDPGWKRMEVGGLDLRQVFLNSVNIGCLEPRLGQLLNTRLEVSPDDLPESRKPDHGKQILAADLEFPIAFALEAQNRIRTNDDITVYSTSEMNAQER